MLSGRIVVCSTGRKFWPECDYHGPWMVPVGFGKGFAGVRWTESGLKMFPRVSPALVARSSEAGARVFELGCHSKDSRGRFPHLLSSPVFWTCLS